MFKRTSLIQNMNVTNVSSSSIFEIGDSCYIKPRSKALAVQREFELFYGNEGNFKVYPIFKMALPKPTISKQVTFIKYNESPYIQVNYIDIISCSSAGVLHIGSTKMIDAESRVKHIRQLLDDSDQNDKRNDSLHSE